MTSSSTSVTSPVGAATLGSETLRDDHEIKIDKMAFRSMLNVGSEQRTGYLQLLLEKILTYT
jgi:hypothetical protein